MNINQTVSMSYIQLLVDYLEQKKINSEEVFKDSGVDLGNLHNQHASITIDKHLYLLKKASKICDDGAIALHLGEIARASTFNVLGYICVNSPTILDGFKNYCLYESLVNNDPLKNKVILTENHFKYVFNFYPFDSIYDRFRAEVSMSSALGLMRQILGKETINPVKVTFKHQKPENYFDEYKRIFKSPISFNDKVNSISFPVSVANLRIHQANNELLKMLEEKAITLITNSEDSDSFSENVRLYIQTNFFNEKITLQSVSNHFGLTGETLRRRLNKEEKTYQIIFKEVKQEKAELLLKNPKLSLQEICFLLKFEEISSFFKAFKKWTGMTPQEYRKKYQNNS